MPHKLLRRKAASRYLLEMHGVVRAPSTLAKYAVIGGGPVFRRLGRDPVYTTLHLDHWVASKLSGEMRSTSETLPKFSHQPGASLGVDQDSSHDDARQPRPRS
jgi:hypothetical protein